MRKIISLSLGVALASTVLVAVPATAGPAAVVRDQGACGMASSGSKGELVGALGTLTHAVQNDHVAVMTCQGQVPNDSGRTQHYSGFMCYVYLPREQGLLITTDSHATVTKNGKATMTCKVSFGTD